MQHAVSATMLALGLLATAVFSAEPAGADAEAAGRTGRVPPVIFISTPHDVVARMLDLAGVQKRDVVYDLGCGDGRIVIAAAKRFGCRAAGFDIDPIRVEESRENVKKSGLGNLVRIERQDVFTLDLRPASVVTLYLTPKFNARLIPQLEKLKPGSRIVSHQFGMPGIKPDKVVQVASKEDGRKHTLYLWTTPLQKRE
jgi:SAM-dependent methyltransferase